MRRAGAAHGVPARQGSPDAYRHSGCKEVGSPSACLHGAPLVSKASLSRPAGPATAQKPRDATPTYCANHAAKKMPPCSCAEENPEDISVQAEGT
jgi:hypothetical protein